MSLRCAFCKKEFPAVPADAVAIGKRHGVTQMYRFSGGIIHNLMSTKVGRRKAAKTAKEKSHE